MGGIHQPSEFLHIISFQGLHRPDGAAVLIDRMLRALPADIAMYCLLMLFKGLLVQIAKTAYFYFLLKLRQRRLALTAALVVLRVPQSPLFVAAGNDDLGPLQRDRRIFKGQIRRV